MKKSLLLLTVLAVAGMSSTSAQAATHYVSGFGGVSWMQNMDSSDTYQYAAPEHNYTENTDLGSGLAVTGAIGCDYGSYRLEAEVGYQTNDVKSRAYYDNGVVFEWPTNSLGTTTTDRVAMKGDVSALTLMANGYYDFDLGSKVELYVTAGVGVAQVSWHNVTNVTDVIDGEDGVSVLEPHNGVSLPYTFAANPDPGFNAHETTLAWQVGAGIAAPIADNVKVDLRYRYFATTDFTVADSGSSWYDPGNTGSVSGNTNLSSHSVLLGLRVDF